MLPRRQRGGRRTTTQVPYFRQAHRTQVALVQAAVVASCRLCCRISHLRRIALTHHTVAKRGRPKVVDRAGRGVADAPGRTHRQMMAGGRSTHQGTNVVVIVAVDVVVRQPLSAVTGDLKTMLHRRPVVGVCQNLRIS